MAASITQQPNEWNVAFVPNVFTLSGIGLTDKKYILTVLDENNNVLAEFRQPANPAGVAHFDVSKVIQSTLEPAFVETTPFVSETPKEAFKYRVRYGLIDANNTPQFEPNQQFSQFKYVINGYDSWRVLNWEDAAFNPNALPILCEGIGGGVGANYRNSYNFLTNFPKDAYPLRSNSYHTLSFFNRMENWADGTAWSGTVIQPAYAVFKFYTPGGGLIQTSIYSIDATTGLGPRTDFDSNTFGNYTNDNLIGTIGAGPQNLKDAGIWPVPGSNPQIWGQVTQTFGSNTNIWNLNGGGGTAIVGYYTVDIYSVDQCYWNDNGAPADESAATLQNYLGSLIYSYRFDVADPCTNFDAITMSFVNQYGVKDYFTFDRRNTRQSSANRSNYTQSLGSWSDATFELGRRGRRTFSTDITTEMTLSSNWMDNETSKWLEELFLSPSVEIFVDGQFEPCVITSNVYEQKTYARDKMFQHTIAVQFANDKKVQRG